MLADMYSRFWGEKKAKNLLEHFNRCLELNVGRLVQQILGGKKKKKLLDAESAQWCANLA